MGAVSGTILRGSTRRPAFIAVATALTLITLGVLDVASIHLSRWFRTYSEADLVAARIYADALPGSAAPILFATDLRTFHSYGDRDLAERGIADFRASPADGSWLFPGGGWTVDVVVLPGFAGASVAERRKMLTDADVPPRAVVALSDFATPADGCQAGKNAPFGWTDDGVVLADPTDLTTEEEVLRCLFAGLAFVNGLPVRDNKFSLAEMPSQAVLAIVLDYVMRCAHDGFTDERPAHRSRAGITTRPSISCVSDGIEEAIGDVR